MMGKRSTFDRKSKDFYETPEEAVWPLKKHLPHMMYFSDPCYGNGAIAKHLGGIGLFGPHICLGAYELYPENYDLKGYVKKADARTHTYPDHQQHGRIFITNPPWDRKLLHPIIDNLAGQKPTWLLFDSDWMHTKQSAEYMKYCEKIVSVGRVKWFPDSNSVGKDNCAWYLFDKNFTGETVFIGR